jgi:hypothetical protein
MLVRLLYASRAARPIGEEDLTAIMNTARANNPVRGITGILCHGSDSFLQVLEGGRMAVNELYNRIIRDDRHQYVCVLNYQEISERQFANWSMGQVNLSKLNPSLVLKYSDRPTFDPHMVSGQASMALINDLIATAAIVGRS